mmetsp:Transcript_5460/g.11120  ORF Transcript_5460/g.11120 Transcript_5460/m.11120 type:complete len:217 (-) Transcript_5460:475-1125(-)
MQVPWQRALNARAAYDVGIIFSIISPRWSFCIKKLMAFLQFVIRHWNISGRFDMFSMTHDATCSMPLLDCCFCWSKSSMRAGARGMVLPSIPSRCPRTSVVWSRVPPRVSAADRRRAVRPVAGPLCTGFGGVISTLRCHLSLVCTGSRTSRSSMSKSKSLPEPGAMSSQSSRSSRSRGRSFAVRRRCKLWRLPASAFVSATASAMSPPRWSTRGSL